MQEPTRCSKEAAKTENDLTKILLAFDHDPVGTELRLTYETVW